MALVAIQNGSVLVDRIMLGGQAVGAVAKLEEDCCCPCACELPLPEATIVRAVATIVLPASQNNGSCPDGTFTWDEFQLEWDANAQHYFKCQNKIINNTEVSVSVTLYCFDNQFRSKALFFSGPCNNPANCNIGDTNFTELGPFFLAEAVHDTRTDAGACLPKSETGSVSAFGATLTWTVWT